jgi:hypothetical protein
MMDSAGESRRTAELTDWDAPVGIEVAKDLRSKIASDLERLLARADLRDAFRPPGILQRQSYRERFWRRHGFLLRSFLYDLRDRKIARGEPASILRKEDMSESFYDFAKETAFGPEVGFVKVVSTPSGADIWIDDINKGRTTKEFVLSTGTHIVEVVAARLSCHRELVLAADDELEVACSGEPAPDG